MEYAVKQSQNDRPAEIYLGAYLDEKALYFRPSLDFYFGDYFLEELTEQRANRILEATESRHKTADLIDDVKEVWSGSLHNFLGYDWEDKR